VVPVNLQGETSYEYSVVTIGLEETVVELSLVKHRVISNPKCEERQQ